MLCSHLTEIGELNSEYLKKKKKKIRRLYKNECVKCFNTTQLSLLLNGDSVMESLCPKHLEICKSKKEVEGVVVVVDLDKRLLKCLKCPSSSLIVVERELNEKENLLLDNYHSTTSTSTSTSSTSTEKMNAEFFKVECHHLKVENEWTLNVTSTSTSTSTELKCFSCDLKENLWICLSCGFIGCGRRQFDGSGGNSHALDHYNDSQKKHGVCLKVFTLLNESPDLYCYQCDDLVHLPFGQLDSLLGLQKLMVIVKEMGMIEKKMEQLEMEKSIDFFSSLTGDDEGGGGEYSEPLFGEFLTGLYNIGNSCYLSSVLQVLFSRRLIGVYSNQEEIERNVMVKLLDLLENHLKECKESSQCDECQLVKMYHGMVSGDYSKKEVKQEDGMMEMDTSDVTAASAAAAAASTTFAEMTEKEKSTNPFQKGIPATMLKDLIGKRHQEFGGGRQQDAYEFYEFMLQYVDSVLFKDKRGVVYEDLFKVDLVQKLQCTQCQRVSYSREQGSISMSMPLLNASSLRESIESGLFSAEGELLNGFKCSDCHLSSVRKRVFIGNAPEVLCMVGQRFMFEGGQVQKRNDGVLVDLEELDFSKFYDDGELKQGEQQMSESSESSEDLEELMGMGFSKQRCLAALKKTKSKEEAMEYILQHLDEPEPEEVVSNKKRSFREEDVVMVMEMGFTKYQAEQALEQAKGSMEQAVELLFQGGIPAIEEEEDVVKKDFSKNVRPGTYELFGIVAHKGKSPHSGHYVAYIKDPVLQQWVLFNDEKVVSIKDIKRNEGAQQGYLYFWAKK